MNEPARPREDSRSAALLALLKAGHSLELCIDEQRVDLEPDVRHVYESAIFLLRAMGWPVVRLAVQGTDRYWYSMERFVPDWTLCTAMPVIELMERHSQTGNSDG